MDHLTELCGEIDADHRDATSYALQKINEVIIRVVALETPVTTLPRVSAVSSVNISVQTIVNDSTGCPAFTIGDLFSSLTELRASNKALETRLSGLISDLSSQGGVVMNSFLFTSEAQQILDLVMKECASGDAFEVFTDTCLLPCFDSSYYVHDEPVGLFPCSLPRSPVYCSSYRLPGRWVVRALSTVELLRLHQIPLTMDPFLVSLDPSRPLPFEDLASAGIYTSILRQLWGLSGGVGVKVEEEEEEEIEVEEVEALMEEELKEGLSVAPVGVTQHSRAMTVLSGPDFQLADDDALGKQAEGIGVEEKLPNHQPQWLFELDDGFGKMKGRNAISDDDTITSMASEETGITDGGSDGRGGHALFRRAVADRS